MAVFSLGGQRKYVKYQLYNKPLQNLVASNNNILIIFKDSMGWLFLLISPGVTCICINLVAEQG